MNSTLHRWHTIIKEKNSDDLNELLAENVVFHSPIVHTPIQGKTMVRFYLMGALSVFLNDHFKYVRELSSEQTAILEFETVIDGILVNGVDIFSWDADGKIIDFKVMVRPLKAINLIHQKMGEVLERMR